MTKYAIIVAAGSGTRFGSEIPKQFLPLAGKPVLMHTISRFANVGAKILLVLPAAHIGLWQKLCDTHSFITPVTIVPGGNSRFESVKNALSHITAANDDIIAVHDGVRPLVPARVINDAFDCALRNGSAIPAINVTDSIRMLHDDGSSHAMDRDKLVAVQTPQTFNATKLIHAYDVDFSPSFTDDASVFERAGYDIHLVKGDARNIKITHPDDILIAENILRNDS